MHSVLIVLMIFLSGASQPLYAEVTADSSPNDVRVLIDVSGSMKQNDPANLRIPALKLLVNLLPSGSNAGIGLFAADAVELMPNARVDQKWKTNALNLADKIHSRGLFTNIETALEHAIDNWATPENATRRSVILLTDGVVDVSKDPAQSAASRKRIIQSLIPRMQQLSAQVHTIALSKNADQELLEKIAFDTGGWNEAVHSAEQLQRIFLKMFNKAVPQDSVPLSDNKFNIDSSITEFSLLVFRKAGAAAAHLIDPNGVELSEDKADEFLHWYHETGYDLVTVKKPIQGEWQLVADIDPDNQVMIVTDLKLRLDELPNYVAENEALDIRVSFTEQGELLTRSDFLDLVSLDLQQTDIQGRKRDWHMQQDKEHSGLFVQAVGETLSPGEQTFRIVANGRTFERESVQTLEVVENPIKVDVSGDADVDPAQITIDLLPNTDIIDQNSLAVGVSIGNAVGDSKDLVLEPDDGLWSLVLKVPPEGERLVVNFSVEAKTLRGNAVVPKVRPVILDDKTIADLLSPQEADDGIDDDDSFDDEAETNGEIDEQPDWVMTAVIAVVVNLVLGVGGFFLYKKIKKRAAEQQSKLIERLAT